jgi:hypothetical protein
VIGRDGASLATTNIPLLPQIPPRLRLAAKQGIIVPFVGAGVSQLCGCPGWDEFANAALKSFLKPGMLDHGQFDQLLRLPPRVKVSVAVGLERQYKQSIAFDQILHVHDPAKRKIGERVYGHLGGLARTFVTTNYDDWLDTPVAGAPTVTTGGNISVTAVPPLTKRAAFFRLEDFKALSLSAPDNVFHIHGSARDRDSMLLTTSDYLERYASHQMRASRLLENPYLEFLGHLFGTKSVMFIGYGLSELEILEYVIQKSLGVRRAAAVGTGPSEEPRHHIVQGFFSHERPIMLSMREYFLQEFNVELLPFSKDENGWEQLIDVLEHLAREIPAHQMLSAQQRHEMEELLE